MGPYRSRVHINVRLRSADQEVDNKTALLEEAKQKTISLEKRLESREQHCRELQGQIHAHAEVKRDREALHEELKEWRKSREESDRMLKDFAHKRSREDATEINEDGSSRSADLQKWQRTIRGEPNTALHTPPSSSSISTSIPRVPLMPASTDRQITMGDLGIGQKSPSLPPAPPMPPGIATPQSAATLSGSRSFAQSNSNPVDTSARAPADASASPNNPTPLATTEGGHICGIPLSSLYFFTDGVTQWP